MTHYYATSFFKNILACCFLYVTGVHYVLFRNGAGQHGQDDRFQLEGGTEEHPSVRQVEIILTVEIILL